MLLAFFGGNISQNKKKKISIIYNILDQIKHVEHRFVNLFVESIVCIKLVINVMLLKTVGQFFYNRNKNVCVNFIILFINYFNLVDCYDLDCHLHQ